MVAAIAANSVSTARISLAMRWGRDRIVALAALVLLSIGAVMIADSPAVIDRVESPPATVYVPDHPVNGKIVFSIPPGAAEAQLDGATPYVMPTAIRLHVGDAVVVTNEDDYPHIILSSLAMPGATTTIVFDEPGIPAFSSGCTANGGTINSFTSVIVSEQS
jgi:hypothetical protein